MTFIIVCHTISHHEMCANLFAAKAFKFIKVDNINCATVFVNFNIFLISDGWRVLSGFSLEPRDQSEKEKSSRISNLRSKAFSG